MWNSSQIRVDFELERRDRSDRALFLWICKMLTKRYAAAQWRQGCCWAFIGLDYGYAKRGGQKGNPIHLAPSLISDLLNRKVDVPKAIKNACTIRKMINEEKKHCSDMVIPFLNPVVSGDMFEAMGRAVEGDEIIAEKGTGYASRKWEGSRVPWAVADLRYK